MAKRIDTKNGRFYEIDGELLPSVTTILQVIAKPYLVPWAAKLERELCLTVADQVFDEFYDHRILEGGKDDISDWIRDRLGRMRAHQKEMDKACDIGSEMHALIEGHLKGAETQTFNSDDAGRAFFAWLKWSSSVDLKPIEIERTVYSKRYGYAGTMDTLAELTDERTGARVTALVDYKSSRSTYRSYRLQIAAYAVAWAEMVGSGFMPRCLIVRLPKDPKDKLLKTDRPFELTWVDDPVETFKSFQHAHGLWRWENGKA